MNSTFESLHLAWQVVVRNWIVYRKDFLANTSPTLADPALMLTALGMGLSPFISEISGMRYAQFLAPGMVATTVLFTAFFECSYGFYIRMTFESVYKAMLTTPIGVREVVIGEFLWVFVRSALMAAGVALALAALGLLSSPSGLIILPLIAGFMSLPCGAIGLLSATFVRNINQFQSVYSFLIAPMYFMSGIFFPLEGRPVLSVISQISPFYHGVRLLQMTAWNRIDWSEALIHVCAIVGFAVVLGMFANRRIRAKLTS